MYRDLFDYTSDPLSELAFRELTKSSTFELPNYFEFTKDQLESIANKATLELGCCFGTANVVSDLRTGESLIFFNDVKNLPVLKAWLEREGML